MNSQVAPVASLIQVQGKTQAHPHQLPKVERRTCQRGAEERDISFIHKMFCLLVSSFALS